MHRSTCIPLLLILFPVAAAADESARRVTTPPQELRLDAFYRKYVSASGLPVVSSAKVSDYALLEAAYLIEQMLKRRPDVLKALVASKTRFAVMAVDEFTTQIPEHRDLKPSRFWDRRARGLGATPVRPAVSCGEENLLRYPGDPYKTENILIHEFAHAIHHMGLARVDRSFDARLKAIYERAMKRGLWKGKYAATNRAEYWAEGVQSYFDTNRPPDHDHNHVDTRGELQEYDRELHDLIDEVFRKTPWRYKRPDDRKRPGHLAGFDRSKAPKFNWPADLERWYREYQRKASGER